MGRALWPLHGRADPGADRRLAALHGEWKLACPKGELDPVFPNILGKVEPLTNIANRIWRPLQRKVGLADASQR
jgi:integrase